MNNVFEMAKKPPAVVVNEPRYQQEKFTPLVVGPEPDPQPIPIWNLDGTEWNHCDPPPDRHEHWAQTVARLDWLEIVYRCPCGAAGGPEQIWIGHPGPADRGSWWRRMLRRIVT